MLQEKVNYVTKIKEMVRVIAKTKRNEKVKGVELLVLRREFQKLKVLFR